jgi:hypothetical protein
MKLFTCTACGHTVYFHNVRCTQCGAPLGFLSDKLELSAFDVDNPGNWRPIGSGPAETTFRPCGNYVQYDACNWMVPTDEPDALCLSCRLNRTIPDLTIVRNLTLWRRLQTAKNRLVYSLLRLRLPMVNKRQAPERGLAFDFLAAEQPRFQEDSEVMTGHSGGLITLDIAEADDAVRERVRQNMAEPYRTVLGHLRHETGHYYWDRLVSDSTWLARFRAVFGDERADYDAALKSHYDKGPGADWPQSYVSAYASSHPWEDWAETWAHYLHMVDTLETAWQFGLHLAPQADVADILKTDVEFDPYAAGPFGQLIARWIPVTIALNSLNQSMGRSDAYPFVLTPAVIEKLALVHEIICTDSDDRAV